MAGPNPEQLLSLAKTDRGALGQLLERYRSYLALLARLQIKRRLQGKLDEEDLVQQTFLLAYQHFVQFRGTTEHELVTWLRRILAHSVAHAVRHYFGTKRRDLRLERQLAAELDRSSRILDQGLLAGQSSPSHQVARRERAVLLADGLARLRPDYREAVILRHLEGLSFLQVAERMGRTVDSVKKLWARALAELRNSLGELA
jgi:RNA polymerase sigma-70 factor (ECF subfamily)